MLISFVGVSAFQTIKKMFQTETLKILSASDQYYVMFYIQLDKFCS